MDTSYSTTTGQQCPQCNRSFNGDLWLIVDVCERHDLVRRICDDTIHQLTCPAGHAIAIDAALLVYDAVNDPALMFSPSLQTTEAQDRQQASLLIQRVRNGIASEWDSEWARNVPFLSRQRLRETIVRRFHNDTDQQITDAFRLLFQSTEPREHRRIIRNHPLLLSEDAIAMMRGALPVIKSKGQSTEIHQHILNLLENSRACGVDKAFADQIVHDNDPSIQIDYPAELTADLNRFWEISRRAQSDLSLLSERRQAIQYLLDQLLPDEYPQFRAGLLNDLSRCWMQLRTGDRQENLRQALATLQQGLRYATVEGTPDEYGRLNQNMGAVYWDLRSEPRQQNLHNAARCFSEALRVRTPERSLGQHLKTLADLGDVYRDLNDPSQATTFYTRMLNTARQYEHPESEQSALAKLGYLAHEAGQLDQSLNYYRQAIAVPLQPTSSHTIIATILERQADIYRQKELTWHLFDSLARSLTLAQKQNDKQRTARLSTQLWLSYRWIGQPHSSSTKPEFDIMASLKVQARIEKLHEHGETASLDAALDWAEAGHAYYTVAESENSVTCFERMLKIADALHDHWLLIHALIGLGRAQYQSGAGSRACEHFEQALVLAREIQNESAIALTLDYLAQLCREIGRLDLSGSAFLEAMDTARQFGRSKQQEEALHDVELSFYQLSRAMESVAAGHKPSPGVPDTIPTAIQADARIASAQQSKDFGNWLSAALSLEEARHIAAEGANQEQHIEAAIELGRIYRETGAAGEAIKLFWEAHQIECEINDPPNILPILIDLAHCYDFLQDWQRAAAAYIEALKNIDEDEDPTFACKVLFSIGWCYAKQQENLRATKAYQQALELSDAAGEPELTWSIQGELGTMAYRAGNYEEAFTLHHAALRTVEDAGLVQRVMESVAKISYLFISIGDVNQAITWGNHWLEYAQRQKDDDQYVRACLHLGDMYHRAGLLQRAMKCFRDVLAVADKYHDAARQCAAAISIGDLYIDLEDSARATEWYHQAIQYAENLEEQITGHYRLARLHQQTEQYALARDSYKTIRALAHESQSPSLEAQALLDRGVLETSDGSPDESIRCLEAAHTIYEEIGDLSGTAMALANLGVAYHTKGEFSQALINYQRALQHSEAFSAPSDVARIERDTAQVLASLGRKEEALQYANSAKMSFIALNLQEEADNIGEFVNQIRSQGPEPQKHDVQDTTQAIWDSIAQAKDDDELRARLRALLESTDDDDSDDDSDDDLAAFMDALNELDDDND